MMLSFSPIANSASKVVILGSMPSAQSLLKRQYYGNERNHFWKLIYSIFDSQYFEDKLREWEKITKYI